MSVPLLKGDTLVRTTIEKIIFNINPFDDLEQQHIQETLSWIQSGEPIFRVQKPDIPPKHLVSYIVLWDESSQKILLVDHKKAQLWVPAGGHVEMNEHPQETAARECFEELKIKADFWQDQPFFLTSTLTVGLTPGHIDISLWYILKGDHRVNYQFDAEEFNALRWFHFDDIPYAQSDSNMRRFIQKLKGVLTVKN